ncbi:serine acetyltransferase [Winogradskyella echinorum]|uniref:Serine acetyltransferase n=1 Tax=Winogradskyella echinorum TaxID=538189 RepID=A0ABR6Y2G5_9FLAO|nr:DapH/DapD/GlmU-related protein [Winogradskyella echinorum]MBC3846939.1 serine acetyltransferase [Winogradskyella echinorum]MBC5751287.1 serine acetyltransferase [Winogradskyella echinorum]
MPIFKGDIKKYKRYSGNKPAIILLLTTQGLWALFVYRISNSIYNSNLPRLVKRVFLFFAVLWQKWIEIVTGISIPYAATIGSEFYIGHFGNIIINTSTIIGDNCNISQGVTIGVSGKSENRGVPMIGNNVYIGANAVIAGRIKVGDNVVIGANSFVNRDVESNCSVLGVPAKKISENTSADYI